MAIAEAAAAAVGGVGEEAAVAAGQGPGLCLLADHLDPKGP